LIQGYSHLRTSVSKGLEIIESLRGHTSGYAIPQYVIDGPGGGGEIPINPNYVVAQTPDSIVLRNYKGDIYEYPEVTPADKTTPEPTPIYRHLEFLDPIEEREEITSRSWRAGRRD
jgi:lysine 2,3-aminomutase